jgi:hypothetical protein
VGRDSHILVVMSRADEENESARCRWVVVGCICARAGGAGVPSRSAAAVIEGRSTDRARAVTRHDRSAIARHNGGIARRRWGGMTTGATSRSIERAEAAASVIPLPRHDVLRRSCRSHGAKQTDPGIRRVRSACLTLVAA